MTQKKKSIPVIDLFAGPGGLAEGFSAYGSGEGNLEFKIAVSMEMVPVAIETLRLRSFFRKFDVGKAPDEYYSFARNEITIQELYKAHSNESNAAANETMKKELGKDDPDEIDNKIRGAIGDTDKWLLIGGPPCQAYSLIGRARLKGEKGYSPERDPRHFLYQEYLRVLAEHQPAVFVMENVKGILSSTIRNERIFEEIIKDLMTPVEAVSGVKNKLGPEYRLFAFSSGSEPMEKFDSSNSDPREFVIYSEKYSIPQARHRVVILGVRNDIGVKSVRFLKPVKRIPVRTVLEDLPRLRSGLSKSEDSANGWLQFLRSAMKEKWFQSQTKAIAGTDVKDRIERTVEKLSKPQANRGKNYLEKRPSMNGVFKEWFIDERLHGVLHHTTRGHMDSDLFRYLYASCFAEVKGYSPKLEEFPADLLPAHASVSRGIFRDRFKVQLKNEPASTITSHISKDGHYYIHYDPSQCRSLTVREVARIQTFPDNYYFCGNRTQQYIQVGNAVPPLLAHQLAEIVADIMGVG